MIPIDLNTTNQKDLYERACRRMSELVPGWSDAIPSDPAVVILELASQLSNMQNYKWNLVGPEHYLAYLKLLGGTRRMLTPASLLARTLGGINPYKGQRYWVDGVPYEVIETRHMEAELQFVHIECGNEILNWESGRTITLNGETVGIHISFTTELPAKKPIRIWCGLEPEQGRVPPAPDTPPPVILKAQTSIKGVWQNVSLEDSTCGLLQSGYWTISSDDPFVSLQIKLHGQLEGTPRIQQLVLEPVHLEQCLTRSTMVDLPPPFLLPKGWIGSRVLRYFLPSDKDGWQEAPFLFAQNGCVVGWTEKPPATIRVIASEPDFTFEFAIQPTACEEIKLDEEGILPERLKVMVQENGVWYDCPITLPDPHHTLSRGCRWDEIQNALRFGDGRDYEIPTGGAVLIAGCTITLGEKGNGATGILQQGDSTLSALAPASGGCERETVYDAFRRVAKEQRVPLRAVTLADYEMLAHQTPGLALGQVHAVSHQSQGQQNAGVILFARPLSPDPLAVLTSWQRDRLQDWLEQYRMIGVPVSVQIPRYLPLAVHVTLRVSEMIDEQTIRTVIVAQTDGITGPVGFGTKISSTGITAALSKLEHVLSVTTLEIHPLTGGVNCRQDGTIHLKSDMLPYLKELKVNQI